MRRYYFLVGVLFFLMACASSAVAPKVIPNHKEPDEPELIPVSGQESFTGCGGVLIPVLNSDYEQEIVEQTNLIRMNAGLTPLKKIDELSNSARYHAADMSNNDYFSHNTFDRRDNKILEVCDTWHRIESFYTNWTALAENIAAGQKTPAEAMEGWMNSPDHRHNILSENYSEIGTGFFLGEGEYIYYWVQNFGRSDQRFPLVIDGDKAVTRSQEVEVFIYGDWDKFRIKVDDGEWSDWQPFSNNLSWSLPYQKGVHILTAEVSSSQTTHSTSDTIEFVP